MTKRFLNVQYDIFTAEVDITGISRLGGIQDAIKAKLGEAIPVAAALIQLYTTNRDQLINTWVLFNSLPQEYFIEGGCCVVIGSLPPPSIQPTQIQPCFPPCQIPFYNDISKAAELNGWLSFLRPIPSSTLNGLYIRESYKTIASSIQPGINKAIITGTPGIGKSLFMIYLLWKLVKAGKRVLLIYHPNTIYYDGQGGVFHCHDGSLPSSNELSFWSADL